ncbi:MAG: chloride channel protein [Proteocatella sp.]
MKKNNYNELTNVYSNTLPILYKSMLIGLLSGIVVVLYRVVLFHTEHISFKIYDMFRANIKLVPLLFLGLGILGYLSGVLVSKFPMIGGSGIPQVKGIIMGYLHDSWFGTLIAKFLCGTLGILGGLSLGREGPSIQLGACIAEGVGDKISKSRTEKKILIASGASAGLAAAFNAPIAGTMFALEEIFKYFSPIILISTMASAMIADLISKTVFGLNPVFNFSISSNIPLSGYWLICLMGLVLGILGALYNFTTLKTQKLYKNIPWLTVKTRPLVAFFCAGVFGLIFPHILGGGHKIIDEMTTSNGISFLLILLVLKFMFSMISFGSGAAGGIFFPLLVMGALIGAIFGNIATGIFGFDNSLYFNFVILAMAGFFTAIVRAPMTGIILLVEMTGSFSHLLSLSIVCIIAYIVADILNSAPIYDSLLDNLIHKSDKPKFEPYKKVTIETVVHYGSFAEGKSLKQLSFPKDCLLVSIQRHGADIIPNGSSTLKAEDYLVFLTDTDKEALNRELLEDLTSA